MRPAGIVLSACIALGAVVYATGGLVAQDTVAAERIINQSCVDCHDVRMIQTAAKTTDEWATTVSAMVEKGAKVAKEDVPVLVAYLGQNHGPVPAGAGRAILLNTCTMCHDLKRIRLGRRSPEEWEETLGAMLNEGAPLSEEQFPVIHAYLSRHFGLD
jgi:cytochrome c5